MERVRKPGVPAPWLRSGCGLTLLLVTLLALATGGPARIASGSPAAQPVPPAFLVRDFSPGPYQPGVGAGTESVALNGALFFQGRDAHSGAELWKSDGTEAGTVLVRDINPGSGHSGPSNLISVGGTLFFFASDSARGAELWKSDGTEAGTVLVRDIQPGPSGSVVWFQLDTVWPEAVNGTLFFVADDGVHGKDLWRSDGTAAGTRMVIDLPSGQDGQGPSGLTNVNGTLFFQAGSSLWKSDGTAQGTVQLTTAQAINYEESNLTAAGRYLFFNCWIKDSTRLCRSDGTPAGTFPLPSPGVFAGRPVEFHGTPVFAAGDGLWRSDGTPAGTVKFKDFAGTGIEPMHLTVVGTTLFFLAKDTTVPYDRGRSVWRSDGTAAGTVKVADLPDIPIQDPVIRTGSSDRLFLFIIHDQLWRSDGTAAGTQLLSAAADIPLTRVQGSWFFRERQNTDHKLAITNGTPTGTTTLRAGAGREASGSMVETQRVGDTLFYTWGDEYSFSELWRSDGTADGTVLIKRVDVIGPTHMPPRIERLTPMSGTLYFGVFVDRSPSPSRHELWKSDDPATGTVLVRDFSSSDLSGYYHSLLDLENINGKLFLSDYKRLWQSDGTAAGTTLIAPVGAGKLTNIGETLFFNGGSAIGRSDGTAAGTAWITEFSPNCVEGYHGSYCSPPILDLIATNNTLFFSTFYSPSRLNPDVSSLWRSDGTAGGARRLIPGAADNLTVVNGTLFFTLDEGKSGTELWKSDGTPEGTVRVRDIFPGAQGSSPHALTAVDEILFFAADDGRHGIELWRSDGTHAGTHMVTDIAPGPNDSAPADLTSAGGVLRFSAWSPGNGVELWESDGTAPGTRMAQDLAAGAQGSNPRNLAAAGDRLFFTASDGSTGLALWASPLTLASRPFRPITAGARAVIQAEDYDRGGEGLAYHDGDAANHAGLYRQSEGVDLQRAGNGSASYALTDTRAGEWLNYTVDIASTRSYTLEALLASQGAGGIFHVTVDGVDLTGPLQVPDTGGGDRWQLIQRPGLPLEKGRHTLGLVLDSAGASGQVCNLDWLALDAATDRVYMPIVQQQS